MKNIKFSNYYEKFPEDISNTRLIQVFTVDKADLSPEFIEYDTKVAYAIDEHYKLPSGKLIILFLLSEIETADGARQELWTTIRTAWPPRKIEYYKGMVGQKMEMLVLKS